MSIELNNISRKYIRTEACSSNTVILEDSGHQGREAASIFSFETSGTTQPHNAKDPNPELQRRPDLKTSTMTSRVVMQAVRHLGVYSAI